jgi:hypothetical protein
MKNIIFFLLLPIYLFSYADNYYETNVDEATEYMTFILYPDDTGDNAQPYDYAYYTTTLHSVDLSHNTYKTCSELGFTESETINEYIVTSGKLFLVKYCENKYLYYGEKWNLAKCTLDRIWTPEGDPNGSCECPSGKDFYTKDGVEGCYCPEGSDEQPILNDLDQNIGYACATECSIAEQEHHSGSLVNGCACPLGTAEQAGSCATCPAGSIPSPDRSTCIDCPDGEYPDTGGICQSSCNGDTHPLYYPSGSSCDSVIFIEAGSSARTCYSCSNTGDTGGDNNDTTPDDGGDTGGDNNDTTPDDGGDTGDDNNDSTNSDDGGSDDGSDTGDTSGGDDGTTDTRDYTSDLQDIQDGIESGNTKLGEIKDTIETTNDKLDDVKTGLDGVNSGLSDINNTLNNGDGSTGYFDGVMSFVNNLETSYTQTLTNYDNLKQVLTGGFTTTNVSGSGSSDIGFTVWGENVTVDMCTPFQNFRPIVAFMVQLGLLILSIRIFIWGLRNG